MLGVCCEFGMGTEQDVDRAEQLYKRGAEQGNATAKLLTDKLKNMNGRGCAQLDLSGVQENQQPNTIQLHLTASANRESLRSLRSKCTVFGAVDGRAIHNIEPPL